MATKKEKIITAVILSSIIAISGAAWVFVEYRKDQAREQEQQRIKTLVGHKLSDPGSAIYQELRFHPRSGATCGRVNAKNKFGGYAGFSFFMVTSDNTVLFAPTTEPGTETVAEFNTRHDWFPLLWTNCPPSK